jgi:hypothetical protein
MGSASLKTYTSNQTGWKYLHPIDLLLQFENALNRTHFDAHRAVKMPLALDACTRIDHIKFVAFRNRFGRALRFAGAAVYAILVDVKCHCFLREL